MNSKDKESLNKLLQNYDPKADGLKKYKDWKKKYSDDLLDFKYIHTKQEFQKLTLGGVVKVISLSNEELKSGGILVKIATDNKKKLYGLLSIPKKNYIWKVYFDYNYIFYRMHYNSYINDDKTDAFKNMLSKFVSKEEINQYTTEDNRDSQLNDLFKEYNKK
jgi:hypothetical protein